MNYVPSLQTLIFISTFLALYLTVLIWNTVKNHVDFYDFLMLSMVAMIPAVFVFFPKFVSKLAKVVGIEFPFLLLFGGLFFIVFIYLYRLVIKVNFLHTRNITLVQEIGLLRAQLNKENTNKEKVSNEELAVARMETDNEHRNPRAAVGKD